VLGHFEAADEVVASPQIEFARQVDRGKTPDRDQQRLLTNIRAVYAMSDLDTGVLPLAQPGASPAADVQDGTYPKSLILRRAARWHR